MKIQGHFVEKATYSLEQNFTNHKLLSIRGASQPESLRSRVKIIENEKENYFSNLFNPTFEIILEEYGQVNGQFEKQIFARE